MEIIKVDTKRIEVQDDVIDTIIGYPNMNVKEKIYIRNVNETNPVYNFLQLTHQ